MEDRDSKIECTKPVLLSKITKLEKPSMSVMDRIL